MSLASDDTPRLLSRDVIEGLVERVESLVRGGGTTWVSLTAWWRGELRWARNRVSLASDRRDLTLAIGRTIDGAREFSITNQLDDASLEQTIRVAERDTRYGKKMPAYPGMALPDPVLPFPDPMIWSEHTYNVTAQQRGAVARVLMRDAEGQGMLSAGYLEMRATESGSVWLGTSGIEPRQRLLSSSEGVGNDESDRVARAPAEGRSRPPLVYGRHTQAQCSLTVRHPHGTGSGWAGRSSYDWNAIDGGMLAERALQKCLASLNPVAIEPGRYTVILEPQAVAELINRLLGSLDRKTAESGHGPFSLEYDAGLHLWRTKLGLKVIDERITISHDPMDPMLGIVPFAGLTPLTFVDRGILRTLVYDRPYSLESLNDNVPASMRFGYRMSGGETTIEEMIATTKRGIVVTRFAALRTLDVRSLLTTGLTRDGLWLVENGTITKSIRNMRFTESPLFALNQVEQLGVPAPIFLPVSNGIAPIIVPPLKTRDFSFTATIDAI